MRTRAICLYLLAASVAWAGASASRNGDTLTLQNGLLTLTVDLKMGARIDSFLYKPFGENIIYPVKDSGGILMDHVWEQTWPGEFLSRRYEAEIVKAGPDEAVVRVWTMGEKETTKGIRFERRLTLKDGERALRCTVSLANTATEGKVTGYWSQNNFWFGGKEGMTWARPMTRGVDLTGQDAQGKHWSTNAWYYIDDATAGWNGTFHRERRQGVMCLFDYNDLWRIYDNLEAVTTEWMYDKVAIPAGKTWSTEIALIPVAGGTGFKHGGAELVANFEATPAPGGLKIEHQLAKGLTPLKDLTIRTKVWGLKSTWTATAPEAKLAELRDDMQSVTVQAAGVEAMPAGIEVTVSGTGTDGKPVTVTYGDYYGGAEGKNNDPFSMKPYLAFERRPKQKRFLKPDIIVYKPNPEPKVLFLHGLWWEQFRVDAAIRSAFPKAEVRDGWLEESPVGLGLTYFPGDYPSLLGYDLIVLANLPAAPLDIVGQEMLKDYAEAGGNLLLLGGDQAFGQAKFTNEGLIKLLPVDLGGPYNWRKLAGNHALKVVADVPATEGVAFGAKDSVFYSHLCAPKLGATVAVAAGDRPILVLGFSRIAPKGGRIACVLATPFGQAEAGETAFWDAPAWATLMQNTVRWLARH